MYCRSRGGRCHPSSSGKQIPWRFPRTVRRLLGLDVSDAVSTLKSDPSKRVTYAELIDGKGDVPAAVEFGRVAAAPVNTLKGRGKNNYQVFVVIHLLQG